MTKSTDQEEIRTVRAPLELKQAFADSVSGKIEEFRIELTSEDGPDLDINHTKDFLMVMYGKKGMGVRYNIDDNYMKVSPFSCS